MNLSHVALRLCPTEAPPLPPSLSSAQVVPVKYSYIIIDQSTSQRFVLEVLTCDGLRSVWV